MSNWDHLKDTIDGILKRENLDDYEPKAVLDFLSTCVFLKMQWQSNTHKPKHDSGKVHQVEYDKAGMVEALTLAAKKIQLGPMKTAPIEMRVF